MLKPSEILKSYWNYDRFRPLQEEIIQSVMGGKDTIALLPTGGGKSICFQVPALAMDGMCIVISPLIALMQDQVKNLNDKNIDATAITSALSQKEMNVAFDNAIYGKHKFLYVSPERLETDTFQKKIKSQKICLIAVDEAHCISQWGYDFRPSYLKIARLRELFPETPVMALTASATNVVIDNISEKLKFKPGFNVFKKSFERKNLHYIVQHEENKLSRLLRICNKIQGTGIVYVRNRKKTKELSDFLNKNNIVSDFYHAGLDPLTRMQKQNDWISGRKRVIVATNAFGMGIDKPDVRFVAHVDLPDSLEAYYQEAGRAGRDGKNSWVVCLYQHIDIFELKENLEESFPPIELIKKVYTTICNYNQIAVGSGKGLSFDFNMNDVSEKYKLSPRTIFSSIRFLEKEGYISYADAFFQPTRLMFTVSPQELYDFQVRNPKMDFYIKTILRSYGGLFTEFSNINEEMLAGRCKISTDELRKVLKKLHELELVAYVQQTGLPKIIFIENRVDSKNLYLSPDNYRNLKNRAEEKINGVINYATHKNECRSKIILQYFDEKNPEDCGQCDVCLRKKAIKKNPAADSLKNQILQLLFSRVIPLDEIISLLYHFETEIVIETINEMADDGIIKIDANKNISK